jgi:hypothetical protein
MNSIGSYRTTRKTSREEALALAAGFATMSDADRLIGGGAVGFLVPPEDGSAGKRVGAIP